MTDTTWNIIGGTLELTNVDRQLALASLTDLVAVTVDGQEHRLGNVSIANGMWGFFAG